MPISDLRTALAQFDADKFVHRHQGHKESRSAGSREYLLTCPKCLSDRLRWNAMKGAWICWGCSATGDTIGLISLLDGCTREEAIAHVLDGYVGGDAPTGLVSELRERTARATFALPTIPWPKGVDMIDPHRAVFDHALAYLARRGIGAEKALEYRLGFGLGGRLTGYVLFPCFIGGGLVYWQARASWDPPAGMSREGRREWIRATNYVKSLNPPARDGAATAAHVLFNFDRARHAPHVVICEGPVDAIKVGPHAVAMLGKAHSPQKVERLIRMRARRYTIYLDRGAEELRSALGLAQELSAYAEVCIAQPPEGRDAGDLSEAENASVVGAAAPWRSLGELQSHLRD